MKQLILKMELLNEFDNNTTEIRTTRVLNGRKVKSITKGREGIGRNGGLAFLINQLTS